MGGNIAAAILPSLITQGGSLLGGLLGGDGGTNTTTRAYGGQKTTSSQKNQAVNRTHNEKKLRISDQAINKIIEDILSDADGLAAIFGGEQSSGLYNSSVAAEEAGDLASKILGEVGKLRATEVTKGQDTAKSRAIAGQYIDEKSGSNVDVNA